MIRYVTPPHDWRFTFVKGQTLWPWELGQTDTCDQISLYFFLTLMILSLKRKTLVILPI